MSSFQYTGAGGRGVHGILVPRRADLGHRPKSADAILPDQNMAEGRVWDLGSNHEHAIPGNVQVWKMKCSFFLSYRIAYSPQFDVPLTD